MFSKFFLLSTPAACAALLLCSCASDVPVPDDPDARDWTPKIRSSCSGWQPPREMPAGNPEYAAAFEKAGGPAVVAVKAESTPVDLEIVGPSPNSCLIDGQALPDRDTDRFLRDFAKANADSSIRITWRGSAYAKKGEAIGDFCKKIGFRQVELRELPEPRQEKEPEIPAPASEKRKPAVSGKLKAEIDRSVPGTDYIVKKGDTLSLIAKKQYHDGNLWYVIYNENKTLLKNANRLVPGTRLHLPVLKKAAGAK